MPLFWEVDFDFLVCHFIEINLPNQMNFKFFKEIRQETAQSQIASTSCSLPKYAPDFSEMRQAKVSPLRFSFASRCVSILPYIELFVWYFTQGFFSYFGFHEETRDGQFFIVDAQWAFLLRYVLANMCWWRFLLTSPLSKIISMSLRNPSAVLDSPRPGRIMNFRSSVSFSITIGT